MVRKGSRGAGSLSAELLGHLRASDALLLVARAFGGADPATDLGDLTLELIYADLDSVGAKVQRDAKAARTADEKRAVESLERARGMLESGTPLRDQTWDDVEQIAEFSARNDRVRTEGTSNLLAAARAASAPRFLAQSIAWQLPGEWGAAVEELERTVLEAGGVALRYGRLYGPGTFYETELPEPPRVHVDEAAERTAGLLTAESGVVTITDL